MNRAAIVERLNALLVTEQLVDAVLELAHELAGELLRERLSTLLDAPVAAKHVKKSELAIAAKAKRSAPKALTTKGAPRQRAVIKCSKCGELGKRADGCGKTHNVSAAPSGGASNSARTAETYPAAPSISRSSKAPPPARSERFAAIEASAQRRTTGVDTGGRPARGAARPIRTDGAEEGRRVTPTLPVPKTTFVF